MSIAVVAVPPQVRFSGAFLNASPNECLRSDERKTISVRSGGNAFLKSDQNTLNFGFIAPTIKHFIAAKISSIAEVERVLTMLDKVNKILYVNTVVNDFDANIRSKIYDKEAEIIDEFEMFDFSFNIISRRGREVAQCITDPGLELTFKRD
jgi:hypothetical protein